MAFADSIASELNAGRRCVLAFDSKGICAVGRDFVVLNVPAIVCAALCFVLGRITAPSTTVSALSAAAVEEVVKKYAAAPHPTVEQIVHQLVHQSRALLILTCCAFASGCFVGAVMSYIRAVQCRARPLADMAADTRALLGVMRAQAQPLNDVTSDVRALLATTRRAAVPLTVNCLPPPPLATRAQPAAVKS